MILVLTRRSDDTTLLIIQWLLYYRKKFFRLNTLNDIQSLHYNISEGKIHFESYHGTPISVESICSYYFNGGNFMAPVPDIEDKDLRLQTSRYLQQEAEALLVSMLTGLEEKRVFGLFPFSATKVNKLIALQMAKECGLLVPDSAIVSSKEELKNRKAEWGRIINKSIDDGISINTEKVIISGQRTVEVSEEQIKAMGEAFFPSLIQKLIPKKYEIRVFFFKGTFYSIAIFSQRNNASKIDGRIVSVNGPCREVPYLLPKEIEYKISALMRALQLNYGAIDLIYSTDSNYYFLEVNPYGQYGFLSTSGNYYLEKQIAEYL